MKLELAPEHDAVIDELAREIHARRRVGFVHVEHRRFSDGEARPSAVADALVESLDLEASGPWIQLDERQAFDVATSVLHRDLAYRSQVIPIEEARAFAQRFIESCGERAAFFTNGDVALKPDLGSWNPITLATFDSGVIGVSAARVAMLWVEDED